MASDSTTLERFKQGIRLARRITHRNVVRTHDLGEVDGMYFITMEYVAGTNLKDLIRQRGKLPIGVTLTIGKQLCRALEVAHEQNVIHRDVKPHNIAVEPSGFIKVMDFGIARLMERTGEGLTARRSPPTPAPSIATCPRPWPRRCSRRWPRSPRSGGARPPSWRTSWSGSRPPSSRD